ncbi:MAG TPA: tetratricopeptide repeat protein [Candidatus Angelobacter sp.]|nr:tetratricopeptide repeat protein [Candidatus Angelobacter sp.]
MVDPAEANGPVAAQPIAVKTWIYGPWIDLVVGCGAWSAPLLLVTAYVSGSKASHWSFAFYFLALLFNYPHFMATVYRAYHSYGEFTKYKIFTVHIALLLAAAGLVAHIWSPLLPWIFTLYICWSPWHYTGQNFGLLMMFVRRGGLEATENERQALHISFIASFILLMLSFQTGASGDPLILSLALPAKFTLPARALLAAFFIASSGWALFSLARRNSWKALLPASTLVTSQFLWFLLPALIELMSGKEVPQTRYSSGILAVLHSAQYLWITSYFQRKEALSAGKSSWSLPKYLMTLVAGGIALFVPGPWIASRAFHADFATSFLTFTALVNLHHFLLDGAIWKLRDSHIASLLLNKHEGGEEVASGSKRGIVAAVRWLAGSNFYARAVRVLVVILLLIWGGIDQLHFYWANVPGTVPALERAVRLNPDDSSAQMRLAKAAETAGEGSVALTALKSAAELDPGRLSAQEAYARALITNGRDQEAYDLYQKVLAGRPRNVDALVNYGLLAQKLGHGAEAVDSWQRAVDLDPSQTNAQLYLAQSLEQRGEMQAAARHYRVYLQAVSMHPNEHAAEGPVVISALMKVADAEAAAKQNKEALAGYLAAEKFAAKIGGRSLQSLAMVHAADAQEQMGSFSDAAASYQQALLLDETENEARAAASDWFNYAQFLRRQKQPERLVYACLHRAEDIMNTTPGQALDAIVAARKESAGRLGAKVNTVTDNLSKLLSEALSLPATAFSLSNLQ